jgi:hypothetical protein
VPVLTSHVTLRAPATGFVRVRLTRTLDMRRFLALTPRFLGSGSLGYALLPDRPGRAGRMVTVVRLPNKAGDVVSLETGVDPVTNDDLSPYLRPGIYRLFALARDGRPGDIGLTFPGMPEGDQRLGVRAVSWAFWQSAAPADAAGNSPASWEPTHDFSGTRPTVTFGAMWYEATATALQRVGQCAYPPGAPRSKPMCEDKKQTGAINVIGPRVSEHERSWGEIIWYEPPGPHAYRHWYLAAGRVAEAQQMMFSFGWTA